MSDVFVILDELIRNRTRVPVPRSRHAISSDRLNSHAVVNSDEIELWEVLQRYKDLYEGLYNGYDKLKKLADTMAEALENLKEVSECSAAESCRFNPDGGIYHCERHFPAHKILDAYYKWRGMGDDSNV